MSFKFILSLLLDIFNKPKIKQIIIYSISRISDSLWHSIETIINYVLYKKNYEKTDKEIFHPFL